MDPNYRHSPKYRQYEMDIKQNFFGIDIYE